MSKAPSISIDLLIAELARNIWLKVQIKRYAQQKVPSPEGLLGQLEDSDSKVGLVKDLLAATGQGYSEGDIHRKAIAKFAEETGISLQEAARALIDNNNIARPPARIPKVTDPRPAPTPMVPVQVIEEVAEKTFYAQLCEDIELFASSCCHIPYRPGLDPRFPDGGYGSILLAAPQLALLAVMINHWLDGLAVRIIVLKSRQMGITTCLLIFWLWVMMQNPGFNVFIIIDKDDHLTAKKDLLVAWINKLADLCPEAPYLKSRSGKQVVIEWPADLEGNHQRCVFILDSAMSTNPGTSEFFRGLHTSERPKWQPKKEQKIDASVLPGLPDRPKTVYVDESTAEGLGSFQDRWDTVIEGREVGHIKTTPIFLAWYLSPEYAIDPLPSCYDDNGNFIYMNDERVLSEVSADGFIKMNEEEYSKHFKLTPAQTYWRRTKINTFRGDIDKFNQEYPTTPEHAWLAAIGGKFFSGADIKLFDSCIRPPALRGNIIARKEDNRNALSLRHYTDYDPVFVNDPKGVLKILELPIKGMRYVLGGDFAEGKTIVKGSGKQDPDWTVFPVKRADSGRTVALWRARVKPELTALPMLLLGLFYNNAKMNGELNNCGGTVWAMLKQTFYPYHYVRDGKRPWDERVWTIATNQTTGNNQRMHSLRRSYIQDPFRPGFAETTEECAALRINPKSGKIEAKSGYHDDIVKAEAYCWMMIDEMAGVILDRVPEPEPEVEGNPFFETMQANGIELPWASLAE